MNPLEKEIAKATEEIKQSLAKQHIEPGKIEMLGLYDDLGLKIYYKKPGHILMNEHRPRAMLGDYDFETMTYLEFADEVMKGLGKTVPVFMLTKNEKWDIYDYSYEELEDWIYENYGYGKVEEIMGLPDEELVEKASELMEF